jgi:ATP-dependent HslUV protease subunit HslV
LFAQETLRAYIAVAFFPRSSKYLPISQPALLNFQVHALNGVLEKLSAAGVSVDAKREEYDYGRFGWFSDPEGNKVELCQPPGCCSPGDGPAYNGRMPSSQNSALMHGTTVLCVRKEAKVVLIADGQVTMGDHVMKHTARKTRRLYQDKVIAGFAGSTADAISLFERFEGKLQEFSGNLQKAAVELAKDWRKDRALRHLEALLIVADSKGTFILSGNGDVIEPDDGIVAIGSGGSYALAAARALMKHSKLNAKDVAMEAMRIASEICIYTNANFTVEELG